MPIPLLSAPVPERKNAKPAVISAGSEVWFSSLELRIPQAARYAILNDKKAPKMAIMRKYITDWKNLPKKEWDAFDKWLKKNFRVERVKGKDLVRVSFVDGNAEEQSAIINVVVDYYLKNDIEQRRDSITKSIKSATATLRFNQRKGRMTDEEVVRVEKSIKKNEELVQNLPKLAEHAKTR